MSPSSYGVKSPPRRISDLPTASQDVGCCVERKMTPIEEQMNSLACGLKELSEIVGGLEGTLRAVLEPEKCVDGCGEKDAYPDNAPLVVELRGLNSTLGYITNRVRSIRTRVQL